MTSYSVDIGTEHIEMVDAALDRTIFAKKARGEGAGVAQRWTKRRLALTD